MNQLHKLFESDLFIQMVENIKSDLLREKKKKKKKDRSTNHRLNCIVSFGQYLRYVNRGGLADGARRYLNN